MASITVGIDIYDYLDDLDDNTLLAELRRRKINMPDDPKGTARTAIAQIQRGDLADAITTLEREFFPKWENVEQSRRDYELATSLIPANDNATAQAVAEEG